MSKHFDEHALIRMIRPAGGDDHPSPEHCDRLRRQALEAFDHALASDRPAVVPARIRLTWRWIMSRPVPRYAAPAALTIAILVSLWMIFGTKQQLAFADLIQPILDAKTATFKMTTRLKGHPPIVEKVYTSGTRIRTERPDGMVMVFDFSQGKMLDLYPAQKIATVIEMKNMPQQPMPASYLDQFRYMLRKAESDPELNREELGEKQVDGQRSLGYRIKVNSDEEYTVWINPDQRRLVRIDFVSSFNPGDEKTMSDFRFDVELDESLFSLEPPKGYTVRKIEQNLAPLTETDFIDALRWASDALDGEFPESLSAKEFDRILGQAHLKHKPTDEDRKSGQGASRGFSFPASLPISADPHYTGQGARRGEKDRPIFWYRPADSDQLRVIYADLTVRDANEAPDR